MTAETENQMTRQYFDIFESNPFLFLSVERVVEYGKLEPELDAGDLQPPKEWPRSGCITIENLTCQYRPHLPFVLRGISAKISSGEKIGICGRTGLVHDFDDKFFDFM